MSRNLFQYFRYEKLRTTKRVIQKLRYGELKAPKLGNCIHGRETLTMQKKLAKLHEQKGK